MAEAEDHRVRFVSGTHLGPEPIRVVKSKDDPSLPPEAHVGLLRSHHTYSVDVPIPHSLGPEVSALAAKTNTCFTVLEPPVTLEAKEGPFKYVSSVKLQATVVKEGSIADTVELCVSDGVEGGMEVLITARIVNCNQGNPLLKDGVHVLSHQHSKESNCTEWTGACEQEECHVRFASGTQLDPEPIRVVKVEDPALPPEAHVGILRNHHTYSVDVPVPHSLGPDVSARHAHANISFTVLAPPTTVEANGEDGFKYVSLVKLQAKTVKEGSVAEKIEVFVDGEGSMEVLSMEVQLTAKVIKACQGNPLLKDGVHVVSHEHTDESEYTEWPGFSREEEEN